MEMERKEGEKITVKVCCAFTFIGTTKLLQTLERK